MLLPALSRAKDRAKRTQCLSNIRQMSIALISYAGDNRDRLPFFGTFSSGGGYWAWDIPTYATDQLALNGTTRDVMYDPGFPQQNNDRLWNWGGSFRAIGYAMTFDMSSLHNSSGIDWCATNINKRATPQKIPYGPMGNYLAAPPVTDRPLLACATISKVGQNKPNQKESYQWSDIDGGIGPGFHRSSHMDKNLPSGGNVGFLDGHGEWRKLDYMLPRTDPAGVNGTCPTFWW